MSEFNWQKYHDALSRDIDRLGQRLLRLKSRIELLERVKQEQDRALLH